MTARTVRLVQTRADLVRPGDVVRPLEWENRRPVFKQVAGVEEDLQHHVLVYSFVDYGEPLRLNPFDLIELQVVEEPRPTPGGNP